MLGNRNILCSALLAAGLCLATPAMAQQQMALPENAAYQHPHTGIEVPAQLGGLDRIAAIAFGPDDLNVGMSFETQGEALSVYIFRNTSGAVPLWFAQAQGAVEARDVYNDPDVVIGPAAFTPPGQSNASGLRAVYEIERSPYQSTGVAVFGSGQFYVKVRASSVSRSPQQLSAWMDEAIAGLTLPAGDAPAVAPVADCEERLRFRGNARDADGDEMANALEGVLGGVVEQMVRDGEVEPVANPAPVTWCRDSEFAPMQVVYRPNASTERYLLALTDSGVAITVGQGNNLLAQLEGEEADEGSDPVYTVRLSTEDRTYNFVSQDRLPRPRRVMQLLQDNRVTSSAATWGDDRGVTINMPGD